MATPRERSAEVNCIFECLQTNIASSQLKEVLRDITILNASVLNEDTFTAFDNYEIIVRRQ